MSDNFLFTVVDHFLKGGIFMWPILAVSVAGSIIFVERLLAYRMRYRVNAPLLFNEIKKYLAAGDVTRAIEVTKQYSYSPLAQVLAAGLTNADRPIEEIDTAMEAEALFHLPKINERINYLALFANLGTLLGLLGTISGLIEAFSGIGGGGADLGMAREEALAGGIGVAMSTTAFGLIVAIPLMIMHQYVAAQANKLIDDIQHYSTAMKKVFLRAKKGHAVTAPVAAKEDTQSLKVVADSIQINPALS